MFLWGQKQTLNFMVYEENYLLLNMKQGLFSVNSKNSSKVTLLPLEPLLQKHLLSPQKHKENRKIKDEGKHIFSPF